MHVALWGIVSKCLPVGQSDSCKSLPLGQNILGSHCQRSLKGSLGILASTLNGPLPFGHWGGGSTARATGAVSKIAISAHKVRLTSKSRLNSDFKFIEDSVYRDDPDDRSGRRRRCNISLDHLQGRSPRTQANLFRSVSPSVSLLDASDQVTQSGFRLTRRGL